MTAQGQTARLPQQPRLPGWLRVVLVGRNPKFTLARIVVLIVACFIIFHFILLPIQVQGISMLPTYKDRSVNFVNRLAYLRHEPRRGDVVNIRLAGYHVMFMKRIVGLPGETIAFENGRVLINGKSLDEPYEKWESDWTLPPVKLAADEYFVVGDNRTMPPDDHWKGKIPRARIVGKVLL
jgi:signal peptidase I